MNNFISVHVHDRIRVLDIGVKPTQIRALARDRDLAHGMVLFPLLLTNVRWSIIEFHHYNYFRSFRRRHTRSRSSSSYSPKRHGQDQKRNSKYGEDSRRTAKKEEKSCTCVCECTGNCKRLSAANSRVKGNSNSKRTVTQSPARDRKNHNNHNSINAEHSFNSKQSSSIADARNNKYSRKPFAASKESKSTNGDGKCHIILFPKLIH